MKKNSKIKETGKKRSFFARRGKEDYEYEYREKKVRHLEDAASFLNETDDIAGKFGSPEDLSDKWGLGRKDSTLKQAGRHRIISFAVAVAVALFIIIAVFRILPAILPGFFEGSNIELFVEKSVKLEYDDPSYRVIKDSVVSVVSEPDPSSDRVTQVLYNEPVTVIAEEAGSDYILIRTEDGLEGYIPADTVISDTDSVEPDLHEYKLVVSESSKNIMTHASQGTLIAKVMMNTVLYADVKRDGVYQVYLPGGETGWIGSSGVIEIGTRENIEEVSCRYFVSSALSLVNSMYLSDGITMNGISINGLVYVCSCVNGIPMPRTVEGQAEMGTPVTLNYDVVTGELLIDSIIPGDIVFLRSPYSGANDDSIYEMAVCTDTGTLLMISSARTTIRLRSFDSRDELCDRILMVRRVFMQ